MLEKFTFQILNPIAQAPRPLWTTAGTRRIVPINNKDFRYLRFRAIGNMEDPLAGPNGNWDGFPYEHFEDDRPGYGYKSFIGKRAHAEHNCLFPGTPILMSDYSYKFIEDIEEGDYVICHDGNPGIVKETFINTADNNCYSISAEGVLDDIYITDGHPVESIKRHYWVKGDIARRVKRHRMAKLNEKLAYNDGIDILVEQIPNPIWTKVSELTVGDFLVIPRVHINRHENEELKDKASIFGLYIAEGCTSGNKNVKGERLHQSTQFSFHKDEQQLIETIYTYGRSVGANVTERFSVSKEKIERYGEPNCVIVSLLSSKISTLFVKYGGRLAKGKVLSKEVMEMPEEWQKEFLASYFEGDACINEIVGIKGSTASKQLALQIQRMILSLGVWCNIAHYTQHTPNDSWVKNSYGNDIYVYSIKPSEVCKLFGERFFKFPSNTTTCNYINKNGNFLVPIKKIEAVPYTGKVYNFEVTSQNSYIAFNISVHNSSMGIAGAIGDLPDAFLNSFILPVSEGVTKYAQLIGKKNDAKRLAVLGMPGQKAGDIEVIMRIDAHLASDVRDFDPKARRTAERIVRMIDTGQRLACSMGTNIQYSVCSTCGNEARFAHEYCFIPDTKILMSDYSVKSICNISVGDEIIDAYGLSTVVEKVMSHEVNEELYSISTRITPWALHGTGNHPFLVKRREQFTFIPLEYLGDKETLYSPVHALPESEAVFDLFEFEKTIENKKLFSRLLGYYAAEGSASYQRFRKNGTVSGIQLSFNKNETALINDVVNITQTLFSYTPKQYLRPNTNSLTVRIHMSAMATILIQKVIIGLATTKQLSKQLMQLPKEYVAEFLRGYFDGDGHGGENGSFVVVSASENLINQVYYLLTKFGITPYLGGYKNTGGPTNRNGKFTAFRLGFGSTAVQDLQKQFDFGLKMSFAQVYDRSHTFSPRIDSGLIKHDIYRSEKISYTGMVFNLKTNSGTYVANNVSVHNCDHIKDRKGSISVISANQVRDLLDKEILRPEWLKHLMISKMEQQDVLKGYSSRNVAMRNVEINHELSFFELSVVANPAFGRAIQLEKFAMQNGGKSSMQIEWEKVSDDDMLRFTAEAQARGLISTECQMR